MFPCGQNYANLCYNPAINLKEIQTFKAYKTESYKYCIIITVSNTKTYSLLNEILLSNVRNVTSDHSNHCIKNHVYNNFNLRYFVSSINRKSI